MELSISSFPGAMTPSSTLRSACIFTNSGSVVCSTPRPAQVGQAPCGLLKLKVCGAISGRLIPQETQVGCSENSISSPPMIDNSTMPPPNFSVVSRESVARWRNDGSISSGITSRSTTTSIVCVFCSSSSISSLKSAMLPSTRTRT